MYADPSQSSKLLDHAFRLPRSLSFNHPITRGFQLSDLLANEIKAVKQTLDLCSSMRRQWLAEVWLRGVLERRPVRLATVALANKMARIAWALMTRKGVYHAKGRVAVSADAA